MRWFRILFAVALLGISGCSSTTAPRFPQTEEDETDADPTKPNKGGFLLPDVQIFFG